MKKKIITTLLTTLLAVTLGIGMDYATTKKQAVPTSAFSAQYNEIPNNQMGWGLKKVKGKEPEIPDFQKKDLSECKAYYIDPNPSKKMYLTFDEGYENGQTAEILDVLKEKNVPAAFFITGHYAKKETELVKRMIDEGHIVGNHTVNHPNLANLSDAEKIADELNGLNEIVKSQYNYDMVYMRPPEGVYSKRVLSVAKDLGFTTVFWSFAYKDWDANVQKGKQNAINEVVPYFHDGAILLLHAVSQDNADALSDIIDEANKQGYEFVSLDSLGK